MERFVTRLTEHCDTSWRIYLRSFQLADAGSPPTAPNGDKRVAIWESPTKRAVIICPLRRRHTRRATFIVARIAKKNFRVSGEFVARLLVWPAAARTTEANSTS